MNEHQLRQHLTTPWLENHGCETYWGENADDHQTFEFTGNGRPDILSLGKHNLLIELKYTQDADYNTGIMASAAPEIFSYLKQLQNGAQCVVDDESIDIDAVVLANEWSHKRGTLFNEEPTNEHFGRRSGDTPRNEGRATELYTRMLWQMYAACSDDLSIGIGTLLSDALDGRDNVPMAMIYRNNTSSRQEWVEA